MSAALAVAIARHVSPADLLTLATTHPADPALPWVCRNFGHDPRPRPHPPICRDCGHNPEGNPT